VETPASCEARAAPPPYLALICWIFSFWKSWVCLTRSQTQEPASGPVSQQTGNYLETGFEELSAGLAFGNTRVPHKPTSRTNSGRSFYRSDRASLQSAVKWCI
jgi:hypothetical protein